MVFGSRFPAGYDKAIRVKIHILPANGKRLAASQGGGGAAATPPPAAAGAVPSKTPLMRRTPFELAPSPSSDILPVDGPGGGRGSSSAQQSSPPTAAATTLASTASGSPALRPASQDGFFGGVNPMAARRLAAASVRAPAPAPASASQPLPAHAYVRMTQPRAEAEGELAFDWPEAD